MGMSHAQCDHPATPKDRAKCRRANGIAPTRSATPRVLDFRKDDDEEHPKDRERCCNNCRLRKILYRGIDRVNGMVRFVCGKCEYILDPNQQILEVEV